MSDLLHFETTTTKKKNHIYKAAQREFFILGNGQKIGQNQEVTFFSPFYNLQAFKFEFIKIHSYTRYSKGSVFESVSEYPFIFVFISWRF